MLYVFEDHLNPFPIHPRLGTPAFEAGYLDAPFLRLLNSGSFIALRQS